MVTCTRILKCDAGHRVFGHEGKCRHAHGHEYKFEITAHADSLDDIGRVIDFSVIKSRVGGWIDEHWDHNFLVNVNDTSLLNALIGCSNDKLPFVCQFNPTAENMANFLLKSICPEVLKGTGVVVSHVRVYETVNCFADAFLDGRLEWMNQNQSK